MFESDAQARENVAMTSQAQVVVFGIGRADKMAKQRGMTDHQRQTLETLGPAANRWAVTAAWTGASCTAATTSAFH